MVNEGVRDRFIKFFQEACLQERRKNRLISSRVKAELLVFGILLGEIYASQVKMLSTASNRKPN